MAKVKALTKQEKATTIKALKGALVLCREPLAALSATHKAAKAAHTKTTRELASAQTKLDKFTKAVAVGAGKIQAKIDAVTSAPTIIAGKAAAPAATKSTEVKKVADKAIAKAKTAPVKTAQPALL